MGQLRGSFYKIRYENKPIKNVYASSGEEAIDKVYNICKTKMQWIKKSLFSAKINDARTSKYFFKL